MSSRPFRAPRPRRLARAGTIAPLLLALPLLCPQRAWAQASDSSLRVEVISCVLEESAVDVSEMLAIARAELAPRALGQRPGDADREPLLRVDACHDEYLLLRSLKPVGPERRIALHDVPLEQRPRVAALALAELVIAALSPSPPARSPEAPARSPAAPASERPLPFPDWSPVEPEPAPRTRTVGVGGEVRLFTDSLGFHYGPRVDFSFPHLDVSLLALFGSARSALGEYRTGVVAVSPSYALYRSPTRARFDASLGADLGITWGTGQPDKGVEGGSSRALTPFVAGYVQLALSGPLTIHTYARIALLGGYALGARADALPVHGDERPKATTQGPFAGLAVGLAWAM